MGIKLPYLAVSGYSDIFKQPLPEDALHYLRKYPTRLVLLRLSRVSAMLYLGEQRGNPDLEILRDVIFEGVVDTDLFQQFTKEFQGLSRYFAGPPVAQLIFECFQNYREGSPEELVNTLDFARDLFRTLLIFNQLYYSRFKGEDFESFESVFKLEIMQQSYLRTGDPLKLVTMMKFAFISKFLDVHESLKSHAIAYFKKIELGNPWLFGKFFMDVLAIGSARANHGKHILEVSGMPVKLMREFEMKLEQISEKSVISLHMDIVPKPFYFFDDKYAVILDYSFFQYAIEQGFFYSFYQNSKLKEDDRFKNFGVFKSYIGLHFFERHLVKAYLEAIFYRPSQRVIATDQYGDFIVRASATDVFLIEVKMTDLHPLTIESLDFQKYKTYLDENFLSVKAKGSKNKGAAQLIRQIDYLSGTDPELRDLLGVKDNRRLNVYPLIICSDVNINIGGVHHYVNSVFDGMLGDRRAGFQSIKPLIMLHVDVLVEYFGPLKRDAATLSNWINGYVKHLKGLDRLYKKHGGIHNYLVAKRGFSTYLGLKNHRDLLGATLTEMKNSFDLDIVEFGKQNVI